MKRIIILSTIVLLIMNLLLGAILSSYGNVNLAISSTVVMITGLLLYLADMIFLRDGYKVSLMLLFLVSGLLEFILSLIAPNCLVDNWWLMLIIILMATKSILLIVTNTVSKNIK